MELSGATMGKQSALPKWVCSLKLRHGTYGQVTSLRDFSTFKVYPTQFYFNHGHSTSYWSENNIYVKNFVPK